MLTRSWTVEKVASQELAGDFTRASRFIPSRQRAQPFSSRQRDLAAHPRFPYHFLFRFAGSQCILVVPALTQASLVRRLPPSRCLTTRSSERLRRLVFLCTPHPLGHEPSLSWESVRPETPPTGVATASGFPFTLLPASSLLRPRVSTRRFPLGPPVGSFRHFGWTGRFVHPFPAAAPSFPRRSGSRYRCGGPEGAL